MGRALVPALAAFAVLALIIGGAGAGILAEAGGVDWRALAGDAYVLALLEFSVRQAGLSALLSLLIAIPLARALSRRRRLPLRTFILRLLGVPMVVPTIVGVLGIVAVWGRSGAVNDALAALGVPVRLDIYGLSGILIAHVFFNMPFAARLLIDGWARIPAESWRLASLLGMTSAQMFRLIEWPMLRQTVPGIAVLVFLLCFTSFAIVLILGGGPPRASLEVAIFQALRLDFDLARAAALGLLQVVVCLILALLVHRLARPLEVAAGTAPEVERHDLGGLAGRIGDGVAIALALAIVLAPLIAVVVAGLGGPLDRVLLDARLHRAALLSIAVGLAAGGIALLLGAAIVATTRELRARLARERLADALEVAGSASLVVPPFVVGAGLFIILREAGDVFAVGLMLVVAVNALMGLPFVIRVLSPAAAEAARRHGRLCESLGMSPWQRLILIDWPLLRRPAGLALALASALALGDFGVIALFGTSASETLPLLLYQEMGAYRMADAAVTALVLVAIALAFFLAIERLVGGRRVPQP
jgi:thiamine transport system permease protein